ncbi:MAG TPA: PQQ-dependent sugar dehydrogenase [Gemmatimonadaceae bacterium]|nr:PQQ-dependent sugar dehydrogenase [Gemmatimonadaceae bacterium]
MRSTGMPRRTMTLAFVLVAAPLVTQCKAQPARTGPAQASPQPSSIDGNIAVETVVSGLEHPWALAFLPDGRILVTERPGRLRLVDTSGRLSEPLGGVPTVHAMSQGGLLDVAIDPDFAQNQLVYLSFSEPGEGGVSGTSVARGRLANGRLENVQVIYRQEPKVRSGGHYGSRLVFSRDGKLFITQGDRQAGSFRQQAQQLSSGIGKIVRINTDGSIPSDNPFVRRNGARPEIWSLGHRNAQAAALHPETGELWTVEHGAQGGDELNRPEKGKNYGWPVITYGREYSGGSIGEGTQKEGMEQPVYYWDPVIAPSGMTFYTGDRYPGWKGSAFIGSMGPRALVRLTIEDGRVTREERYLGELGERIRDVQQGPDGLLYLVTDAGNGKLLRVVPKSAR